MFFAPREVIVPPSADPAVTKPPEIRRRRRDSVRRTRARGVDNRSDVLVAVSCAVVPPLREWRPSEYQARTSTGTGDG